MKVSKVGYNGAVSGVKKASETRITSFEYPRAKNGILAALGEDMRGFPNSKTKVAGDAVLSGERGLRGVFWGAKNGFTMRLARYMRGFLVSFLRRLARLILMVRGVCEVDCEIFGYCRVASARGGGVTIEVTPRSAE